MTECDRETAGIGGRPESPFLVSYFGSLSDIASREGAGALWTGLIPRIGKALLSGAVQFGSYELSKGRMAQFFSKK
jgi:solute carrier family 25 S-adenosylmethionine transporter 26